MQNLITASQASRTEASMTSQNEYIPFFSENPAYPDTGIQFQKVSPYINLPPGAPYNNSVVFKLPSGSGFLYNASVGISGTCTALPEEELKELTSPLLIRELTWESAGQPIITKTKNAIISQIKKWGDISFKIFSMRYAKFLIPATEESAGTGNTTFLTYLPLLDTFLTDPDKALLLNSIKDLSLRITFDSKEASGLTTTLSAVKCEMFIQTYMPKLSVYNQIVEKDWSRPFQMSMVNCYEESATLTDIASLQNYTFTVPYLVLKTHIFVRSTKSLVGVGPDVLPYGRLRDFSMNLAGVQFLSNMPASRINEHASKRGITDIVQHGNDGTLGYEEEEVITIDWGFMSSRNANSGAYFGDALRGTNISVMTDLNGGTAGDYRLYVIHEYWQRVEFQPSSGGGTLAVVVNN